ncbi:MAG: ribonuclease P protein subunit [Candidatus Aenigmatarchaeota archaeon]|nr:MAG: ribonuclease P protein subunit [Candidatus Aenigmarchaeota archaeon]
MISANNIVRHELIGLEVEVVSSTNASQKGMKGTVTDETRQTITIDTGKGEKNLAKDSCTFRFMLPDGSKVDVEGSLLVARPEDRIKKKLKNW